MSGGVSELGGMKIVEEKGFDFLKYVAIISGLILVVGISGLEIKLHTDNNLIILQQDLNILKENDLALAQNQRLIIDSIRNNQLCGNGQFIPDSNRLNEVPRGIVYSCFIQEVE